MQLKNYINKMLLESVENDISVTKSGEKVYNKIVKSIDKINFVPTDGNDFVTDSRGKKHLLKGVKFNLNQLFNEYGLNVLLINKINDNPYYDAKQNNLVFQIISQVNDKDDFNNNLYLAKLRFKSWVDISTFVHEFTHFLDSDRYKSTYKFNNPKTSIDYYSSPEEYNAYYQELLHNIKKNKRKLNLDDFNIFLQQILEYGDKNFLKMIKGGKYENKLKSRLYNIFIKLKSGKQ